MNFTEKIKNIIKEAGYSYKVRSWENPEYTKVIVYAGRNIEKLASKRSRRLVAWKENGVWQGNKEAIERNGGGGGDNAQIYSLDYHDKTEPLKYTMFSDFDWNRSEKYARNILLEVLKNWDFAEKERQKL